MAMQVVVIMIIILVVPLAVEGVIALFCIRILCWSLSNKRFAFASSYVHAAASAPPCALQPGCACSGWLTNHNCHSASYKAFSTALHKSHSGRASRTSGATMSVTLPGQVCSRTYLSDPPVIPDADPEAGDHHDDQQEAARARPNAGPAPQPPSLVADFALDKAG